MIKGIPMVPNPEHQVIFPINNVLRPLALDFDAKTEYIYFSDTHR